MVPESGWWGWANSGGSGIFGVGHGEYGEQLYEKLGSMEKAQCDVAGCVDLVRIGRAVESNALQDCKINRKSTEQISYGLPEVCQFTFAVWAGSAWFRPSLCDLKGATGFLGDAECSSACVHTTRACTVTWTGKIGTSWATHRRIALLEFLEVWCQWSWRSS